MTESAPPTDSEQWRNIATVVSDNQKEAVDKFQPPSLQVPSLMHISTEPQVLHEGSAFTTQPAIGFQGQNVSSGNIIRDVFLFFPTLHPLNV